MSAYYDKTKLRWVFEFDKVINGQRVRATKALPKGWGRAQAQDYARKEEARLYAVATGQVQERVLIETAVALYVEHRCPELKDGLGIIKELSRIHWLYAGRYMDELAEVALHYRQNAFHEKKDEHGNMIPDPTRPLKPATIKNKLSYLRAACIYAQEEHKKARGVDLSVSMPEVNNERHEYMDRAQMIQIARKFKGWTPANRYARALLRIGFYSGMRLGEMMRIEQEGYKSKILKDEFLYLVNTKNGKNRLLPVLPKLRVLLRYFPVPYKKRWIQRKWEEARDAAGFKNLVFHDVRHSAASAMVNNDVDLKVVGAVLGHKDRRSTDRYAHLQTSTLARAMEKIK